MFSDWEDLLALLQRAFAAMEHRIEPPSSLYPLDAAALAEKSHAEILMIAEQDGELVGCVFARTEPESVYLSKLAVDPDRQGRGIGRRLMEEAEDLARDLGRRVLELDTRIELVENHQIFAALGYAKTSEHAHEGFDRPTFITMRKHLSAR